MVFFFKQKTAYEMRISDWSSDVCSSDLYAQSMQSEWGVYRNIRFFVSTIGSVEYNASALNKNVYNILTVGLQAYACIKQNLASEIGRASCRERVCQYVYISLLAVTLKKK